MSDWTYEMLRYAFSWNESGAEKAVAYIYDCDMPGAKVDHTTAKDGSKLDPAAAKEAANHAAKLHLLNTLLSSLFTDADSSSALIFLEEHCESLLTEPELIEKALTVLEKFLVMPAEDAYDLAMGGGSNSSSSANGGLGANCDAAHSIKGHVIVTYTSLLIQTNCIETDPIR